MHPNIRKIIDRAVEESHLDPEEARCFAEHLVAELRKHASWSARDAFVRLDQGGYLFNAKVRAVVDLVSSLVVHEIFQGTPPSAEEQAKKLPMVGRRAWGAHAGISAQDVLAHLDHLADGGGQ